MDEKVKLEPGAPVEIYTDGSLSQVHGAHFAFVVFCGSKEVYKEVGRVPTIKSNDAEAYAIRKAVRWVKVNQVAGVRLYTDSQSSVVRLQRSVGKPNQITTRNGKKAFDVWAKTANLIRGLGIEVIDVPRHMVKDADGLIRQHYCRLESGGA